MRLLLAVGLLAVATPALADFDNLKAQIEHTHAIAERARAAAHEALEEKYRKEQAANDARWRQDWRRADRTYRGRRPQVLLGCAIRINTTMTASHTREQWVYGGGYLYLTDGIVTSIQTSR